MVNPPNPFEGTALPLNIDWGLDPDAVEMNFRLVNMNGYVLSEGNYRKPHPDLRFDSHALPLPSVPGGMYVLEVRVTRANSLVETRQTLKLMLR